MSQGSETVEPSSAGAQGLRAALRRGGLGAFWFALGSPTILELSLTADPDLVVIDLQHGLWDRAGLEQALGIVPARIPTIARLAGGSPEQIGEALDAGAHAVLIPLVETAAQTADCIAAAHYPPRGRRSGGGVRPLSRDFARYVREAAERTCVGVMIETAAGVEQADGIAATPGLDFVFIGTGDLALSLGCFPQPDERHEAACRRVFDACAAHGVPCGIFTGTATAAARRLSEGFCLAVLADDIDIVANGFARAKATSGG
jgi:2-keto-3-deoxy-L-rhamnonate aldolase RhmA